MSSRQTDNDTKTPTIERASAIWRVVHTCRAGLLPPLMIWAARFLHFELELAYTKIHAPIDGRVTKTDITELSAVIIDKQNYINFSISDHQLLKRRRARIQLPLRAVFDNPNGKLLPGLFVRIRMPVSEPQDTILIPARAIVRDRDTSFVMVVGENNLVQRRNVQLGEQTGGRDRRNFVCVIVRANQLCAVLLVLKTSGDKRFGKAVGVP